MVQYFTHLVENYGYFAVILLVMAEGFGIPLPGETAVVTAAAFAGRGSLSLAGVAMAATLGTVLGGSGGYWMGRKGGRALVLRWGHIVRLDERKLVKAEKYFSEHGVKTVFFARFIALLRILGSLMAGVSHMPFVRFSAVNLAGGLLWSVVFSALGYLFGRNLHRLEHDLGLATLAISIAVVIAIVVVVRRRRR